MEALQLEEYIEEQCELKTYTLEDYEGDVPRWCKGCGDFGILSSVQKLLRDDQVAPESVVAVSGIGCSSRFPHYLNTYGFHGIHGRAMTIATGVKLGRPDLKVLVTMGDGDCFSIGGGHWLHSMRYNTDLTVIVMDNEIYALTKNQVSPTTHCGTSTNTTPHGAVLKEMNVLSVMLGITNTSFLAQTASWTPGHLDKTIKAAWNHKGTSFVRVLQKCPIFSPQAFGQDGKVKAPFTFLRDENGIPVDKVFEKMAPVIDHNCKDLDAAKKIAMMEETSSPLGLLYHNPSIPTYEESLHATADKITPEEKVVRLNEELDKYTI
ncbi:MAG: thiamine pyrophosphate-dependent enzyme [Spirochaetia bacterium]|nr:thiamine pyrophosphate-dependent enzyme [Spirochaetia bacterium]